MFDRTFLFIAYIIAYMAVMLSAVGGVACSQHAVRPQNVLAVACAATADGQQIERCAKAIAEVYLVYQRRVADIVLDRTTPPDVKKALQAINAQASGAIHALNEANILYITAKRAAEAAAVGPEPPSPIIARAASQAQQQLHRQIAAARGEVVALGEQLGE